MADRKTKAATAETARRATAKRGAVPRLSEDDVYERIYRAVLDHRLEPGTKLKEIALADVFGVSRGVVRKVLTRLAYAKLVQLKPNRGASVASPSAAESRDLFAARRAVEGSIVDALARRVTALQARRLRTLVAQERAAYDAGESRKALKMSLGFHRELAAMGGNRVLADILDQLIARTPLVVLAFKSAGRENRCGGDDHADIVAAIVAGQSAKAVDAMTRHLQTLEDQLDLSERREEEPGLARLFETAVD